MRRAVQFATALLAAFSVAAGGGSAAPTEPNAPSAPAARFAPADARITDHRALTQRGVRRLRASAWWGGAYTSATGEQVTVYVSASYPQDDAVARSWADFFAALLHGAELQAARIYVAPLAEVGQLCGTHALGCYGGERIVTIGDEAHGVSAHSVAAHEYGHHVAAHRLNPPWRALDWGPKRWATAMGICGRAAAGTVFPGDQGARYELNPGEAFAESYRLLNERRADPTASSWPILDPSLFPSVPALAAAGEDVVRPWSVTTRTVRRGRFAGGGNVWTTRVRTPLDGELRVTLDLPPATPYRLEISRADGRVLARGLWSSQTRQVAQTTICGSRALSVRIVRQGPAARFAVTVTTP